MDRGVWRDDVIHMHVPRGCTDSLLMLSPKGFEGLGGKPYAHTLDSGVPLQAPLEE